MAKETDSQDAVGTTDIQGVLQGIASYWPAFVIRGTILLFLGFIFVVFPETTVNMISIIFGVLALLEACGALLNLWASRKYMAHSPARSALMTWYGCKMVANATLGLFAICFPNFTARILLIVVAVWFLVVGILELMLVLILRGSGDLDTFGGSGNSNTTTCFMMMGGMIYLMFGVVLLTDLDRGVITFAVLIGLVIMLFATQITCFGWRLRSLYRATTSPMNTTSTESTTLTPSGEVV